MILCLLLYLAASERTLQRKAQTSQWKKCYQRMYRFMVQGLVHSTTGSGSLPDTLIKTAQTKQLLSSISAAPQGNNITHLNVAVLNHFQHL